jgi:linoleoyl-CoA desaturase
MSLPADTLSLSPPLSCPAELWRSVQPTASEIRAARRRLHAKAVSIVVLFAASYFVLVVSNAGLLLRLGAAGVLALSVVAVATGVMHDANHGAFSKHRLVNHVLAYTSDALGASSWLWRIQHNLLHHANTNVVGFDADLELSPWARVAPTQPWRRRFRWQHVYIWPLYGLLALKNLLVSDLLTLVNRRVGAQPIRRPLTAWVVVRVVLGKLAHVSWAIVVPLMFNPWWAVLTFYLALSWMVGFTLAMIFQLAHCVDAADMPSANSPRRGADFVAHQLRTTVNIASPVPVVGHLFRWLAGGLDHQIEHHLAPGLPHTIYPSIARRFQAACGAHGVTYRRHSGVWAALRSHTRWLQTMGRPITVS